MGELGELASAEQRTEASSIERTADTAHSVEDDQYILADAIIEEYIRARGGHIITDEDEDLDARAERALLLVWRLTGLLARDASVAWERDCQIRDLTEEVQRHRHQLRDSIPLADRASPPFKPRTALEAVYEMLLKVLESENKDLRRRLAEELSRNLELEWRCRDLREEVWRLNVQLRNSISLSDAERPPWRMKTALERALEDRIMELDGRIRNPLGRGRSNSM